MTAARELEPPLSGEEPFARRERVEVHARYVAERIDIRALSLAEVAQHPLTVRAGEHGLAVIFRYGVVVFFDATEIEQAAFLDDLARFSSEHWQRPESEEAALRRRPGAVERATGSGDVALRTFDVSRMQLVADVLAKSVVLAHYERAIAEAFGRIEPLAASLERHGQSPGTSAELLRHIGGALLIQARTLLRVEISDKPDLLWEQPDLEPLYARMADEYELDERYHELGRKLALIERTASTALELLQHDRALRVEWYIVILIVVEIVLSLYDIFFRG